MPEFEIWCEGYRATGEHATANLIGKAIGATFDEACENFTYPEDVLDFEGKRIIIHKGDHLALDKEADGSYRRGSYRGYIEPGTDRSKLMKGNYSMWACQLFDNEADARKSYG